MIPALFDAIAASPWVRAAVRYGAIVLAVLLFLLSLRRSGERAGRLVERLESTEKANDAQRRMLEAAARRLILVTSWLSACAPVGSERAGLAVCPPVVEYSREFQARAADELALLPEGTALADILSDYAVMREQARACRI